MDADLTELSRSVGLSETSSEASSETSNTMVFGDMSTMDFGDMSKTTASQHLKGSQSYYYWHSDAERRRATGENPVPAPIPIRIATASTAVDSPPGAAKLKPIESFSLYAALAAAFLSEPL